MKRPNPTRRAVALAVPRLAVTDLWLQLLAAAALVAFAFALAGVLR